MRGRLLVVGVDGLIGSHLADWVRQKEWEVIGTTRRGSEESPTVRYLDLSKSIEHWPVPGQCSAAVLFAGIHKMEECRKNPEQTRFINVSQTAALAKRLIEAGVFVVFPSSNYVFDGTRPLRRADEPVGPRSEYGRQKAEVEVQLLKYPGRTAVVRLNKVFHGQMPLIQDWIRQLKSNSVIRPFRNLFYAPIPLDLTVWTLGEIALRQAAGIWHLSAREDVSYEYVARQLAELHRASPTLIEPADGPENAEEKAPQFTSLDCSRLERELGVRVPAPAETIRRYFAPGMAAPARN